MQTRRFRFVFILVRVPSDDVIAWLDENIQRVCAESAVKFNILDVVIVVLSYNNNVERWNWQSWFIHGQI